MRFYGKFRELTVQLCLSAFYFISERAYSPSPFCYKDNLFCALYVKRATVTVLGSLRYWPSFPAVHSNYHVHHISAAIPALTAGRSLSGMQIMRRKCGTVELVIMFLGGGLG